MSHTSHGPQHGAATSRARMNEAMTLGATRYADTIATLNSAGLPTVFTQTGGMFPSGRS